MSLLETLATSGLLIMLEPSVMSSHGILTLVAGFGWTRHVLGAGLLFGTSSAGTVGGTAVMVGTGIGVDSSQVAGGVGLKAEAGCLGCWHNIPCSLSSDVSISGMTLVSPDNLVTTVSVCARAVKGVLVVVGCS